MHKIHFWVVRCLAVASFICTLPASAAYLQFTYTNHELFFTSHRVAGVPTVIDSADLPTPSFSLSFTVPEKDFSLQPSTTFFTRQLNLTLSSTAEGWLDFPILLSPSSYAQVSLNQEGQITDWNLVAFARELITPETDLEMHRLLDSWASIRSNSATGDQLTHRYHAIARRQDPIQAALLEFNYADTTSLSNWTVTKIPVPEPGLAGLLLSGLGVLLWCRRQDKSARSR